MTRPRYRCDVPGCASPRKPWQRLCRRCWAALPGDVRTGLAEAHGAGRTADHAALKRTAGELLARAAGRAPAPAPSDVYRRTAAMLGERE